MDPDTVLEKLKIINAIEKQEYSVEMPVQPAAFDHTEFVQKREVTRHDEVLKVGKKVKLLEDTFIQKIGSKSKILPDEYNVIRYEPTKDLYVLKACVPKDDDQRKDDEIYVPSWRLVEKLPNPDEELEDEEVLERHPEELYLRKHELMGRIKLKPVDPEEEKNKAKHLRKDPVVLRSEKLIADHEAGRMPTPAHPHRIAEEMVDEAKDDKEEQVEEKTTDGCTVARWNDKTPIRDKNKAWFQEENISWKANASLEMLSYQNTEVPVTYRMNNFYYDKILEEFSDHKEKIFSTCLVFKAEPPPPGEKTEPEKPKVHYKNDLLTDAQREASDIASEYPLGILTGYVLWQYKKLRA